MIFINDTINRISIEEYQEAYARLSTQRRNYVNRFRLYEDRVRCVFAYDLLRNALRNIYGINTLPIFSFNKYGKPFLEDINLHISLSHCKNAVVCSIDEENVGVDAEDIKSVEILTYHDLLNDYELESIYNSPNMELEFATLWTKKESISKLLGCGITPTFNKILAFHKNDVKFSTIINMENKYVVTEALYSNS